MDLKTLWDRTNDAINTIIRRDESSETGELLPPCIEGIYPFFSLYFLISKLFCFSILLCIYPLSVNFFSSWE